MSENLLRIAMDSALSWRLCTLETLEPQALKAVVVARQPNKRVAKALPLESLCVTRALLLHASLGSAQNLQRARMLTACCISRP